MRLRIALVTAAISLALPAVASADTFCVNKPSCLIGTPVSTVQDALDAASANPGPDVVRIGARAEPYQGPFTYDEFTYNPVQIVGDGTGETVLVGTSSDPALRLGQAGSEVSGLTIRIGVFSGGAIGPVGLELSGAVARNVSVVDSGLALATTGVVTMHDAGLRAVTVDMSGGVGVEATNGPQGTTIQDSSISAGTGVMATHDATATLRNVRLSTKGGGASAFSGGRLRLSNVLVSTSVPEATGLLSGEGADSVTANHVTIARSVATSGANGVDERGGSVSLQNTIIHGYSVPILRQSGQGPLTSSDLSVRYTNFDQAASLLNQGNVPGTVSLGPGNRNEDPRFAGLGDFHLRGDSPLIDAGEVTPLSSETDIDGLDRSIDGDGDGDLLGEVDLGAYEYQRSQPLADFSFGPATAGAPVAFDPSPSSDPDPGDESGFAYQWSFGDGSLGSGPNPAHAYPLPGDYTVGLTVTDPSGLTAATTRVVSVAPALDGGGGDSGSQGGGGAGADNLAPAISELRVRPRRILLGSALARLAARGGRISFRLSEPARVTLRFASARTGKRKGVLRLNARAGLNTVRFAGRLTRRRTLPPGTYRLTVLAKDAAGNAAKPQRTRFTLIRR
jgi:PKD domain